MKSASAISGLITKKRLSLRSSELETLLEMIPEAAIVADAGEKHVIAANAQAVTLTAYSRKELLGSNVDALFIPIEGQPRLSESLSNRTPASNPHYILVKHGGSQTDVNLKIKFTGPALTWAVIQIEGVKSNEIKLTELQAQNQFWQALNDLTDSSQQTDCLTAIQTAIHAGKILCGAQALAVYQFNQDHLVMEKTTCAGQSWLLPEQIPPGDIMSLQTPALWSLRMRATAGLHREARANGLAYLASIPLGQTHATIGLVVAGGLSSPSANLMDILRLLSANLTRTIQQHALIDHLNIELQSNAYTLFIGDIVKDHIKDGLIILDPNLVVCDMNRAAEQSLGYLKTEVAGQAAEDVLISDQVLKPSLDAVQKGQPFYHLDNARLYRRNGQSFPANLHLVPISVESNPGGVIIIFQDISEREQFRICNEQLEQRALLGEVTASFAHEVRNPINNISTGLQLLELKLSELNLPQDDSNLENVKRLQQDCNRLTELIKSGLSFIKPIEYKMEAIDLGSLVKNLLDRWQHRLQQYNILCQFQVENHLPQVEGDLRAMEQIFSNLINNAAQAMQADNINNSTLAIKNPNLTQRR